MQIRRTFVIDIFSMFDLMNLSGKGSVRYFWFVSFTFLIWKDRMSNYNWLCYVVSFRILLSVLPIQCHYQGGSYKQFSLSLIQSSTFFRIIKDLSFLPFLMVKIFFFWSSCNFPYSRTVLALLFHPSATADF